MFFTLSKLTVLLTFIASQGALCQSAQSVPITNCADTETVLLGGKANDTVNWRAKIGSHSGAVTVSGEFVFVGTNNANPRHSDERADGGVVMCFSAMDGEFLWQSFHPRLSSRQQDMPYMPIVSLPTVKDGRCYYMSNNSHVVCADLDGFRDSLNDGPFI